ncbi:hypothetical protein [Labedaea rhizosphaerae]|uniref:hypothetical protein n=1 Tax=Labedaea rhizosphaerae TaxID=598644 RepID=UPI00106099AD|nr:hypothetical protein [Labedaea rhizosphaerae]
MQLLLDMYESAPQTDWRVDVDRVDQDSADILVYGPAKVLVRAIQVKASMPASSTTMGIRSASGCLDALQSEHPNARELTLITNRTLTVEAVTYASRLNERHGVAAEDQLRLIDARRETLLALTSRLVERVAQIRVRGSGGIGHRLHHILVAQLVDLVHDRGSQTAHQGIDHDQVARILEESTAVLADAVGGRGWGRAFGVPDDRYLPRSGIASFLSARLPGDGLLSGTPPVAVLSGISGSGKSAAAAAWAASRRDHYAFTLWLDASSDEVLTEQQPAILGRLGTEGYAGDAPAQIFCDLLSDLPVPWLLVLDGAVDWPTTRKWIPPSGYGHVVVTTNRGDWPTDTAPLLEVNAMSAEEATALIRDRLSPSSAGLAPEPDPVAAEFATRLGSWPLAIDLACAWVRSLGGDLSQLQEFLDRLDRFDLTEQESRLGSYPRSAGRVVRELLDDLSGQAFAVLTVITASGGSHVPVALVDQWASSLPEDVLPPVDARTAIDELIGASLAKKRLRFDIRSVHGLDEAIYIHDGILAVVQELAIGIEIGYMYHWMCACTDVLTELVDQAVFSDASALLPVADRFLTAVLSATPDDAADSQTGEWFQLSATALMHNVGLLATLTGLFELASKWLTTAFRLRERMAGLVAHDEPALAVMQIQTLAMLVGAVLRVGRVEEIRPILEAAVRFVPTNRGSELTAPGTSVSAELRALAEAARYAREDCSDLRSLIINALRWQQDVVAEVSPLQVRVREFASTIERAQRYAEGEQWSKAVDTVLVVVNEAAAAGVLTHDGIEAILDIGLALLHSLLTRPHRPPPESLKNALRRITQWCDECSELLNDDQRIRLSVLIPVPDQDVQGLHRALENIRAAAVNSNQLRAWLALGEAVEETITASNRIQDQYGLGPLPDWLRVVRSIDGGTDCLWWPAIARNEAVLVFVTASLSMFVGDTVQDPMRESMVQAGFPDRLDVNGQPQTVAGWTLHIDGLHLALRDAMGNTWLEADVNPDEPIGVPWIEAIGRADWVRVVYTDPADQSLDELLAVPNQGFVAVVGKPVSRGRRLRNLLTRRRRSQ